MRQKVARICTEAGCAERYWARGYCRTHYRHLILGVTPRPQSKALMRADPKDARHGTANGYGNCGCRCERCTAAKAEAMRAYLDADPERRRRWNARQLARLNASRDAKADT